MNEELWANISVALQMFEAQAGDTSVKFPRVVESACDLAEAARKLIDAHAEERRGASSTGCCQDSCGQPVSCSLVWPGRGRLRYCARHAKKALAVANTLGVVLASLDLQIVE